MAFFCAWTLRQEGSEQLFASLIQRIGWHIWLLQVDTQLVSATLLLTLYLTLYVRMVITTTGVNAINYSFEKRQREIAKQKKKDAKRDRKTDKAGQSDKEEYSENLV
ncbi:MAG: hypothetical protein EB086_13690 [Rhodobacteraceae bacterium]|nr:hypothetical protein [Paracoccaceae bacterium]